MWTSSCTTYLFSFSTYASIFDLKPFTPDSVPPLLLSLLLRVNLEPSKVMAGMPVVMYINMELEKKDARRYGI